MQNFKLGILIPLKARRVAKDWSIVEMALERVLSSINNQTSRNFECVVVGHDEPEDYCIDEVCKNTRFVKFDEFKPPDQNAYSSMELQLKYEFDRCSKIAKGMMYLQSQSISHWFALDADDLLHANFVESISKLENYDAIVIDNGYFYFENRKIINKTNNLSSVCGSSCIIKAALTAAPYSLDSNAYRTTFYGKVPHMNVKNYFAEHKLNYVIPEDRLIMYIRDHGENISSYYFTDLLPKIKKWIKQHIKVIRFSREQYESFGFKSGK